MVKGYTYEALIIEYGNFNSIILTSLTCRYIFDRARLSLDPLIGKAWHHIHRRRKHHYGLSTVGGPAQRVRASRDYIVTVRHRSRSLDDSCGPKAACEKRSLNMDSISRD